MLPRCVKLCRMAKRTGCQVKMHFKEGLEAFLDKSQDIVLSITGYMRAFR